MDTQALYEKAKAELEKHAAAANARWQQMQRDDENQTMEKMVDQAVSLCRWHGVDPDDLLQLLHYAERFGWVDRETFIGAYREACTPQEPERDHEEG